MPAVRRPKLVPHGSAPGFALITAPLGLLTFLVTGRDCCMQYDRLSQQQLSLLLEFHITIISFKIAQFPCIELHILKALVFANHG